MALYQALEQGPDVDTASEDYAGRFRGAAGHYLLAVQERVVREVMPIGAGLRVLDVGGGHAQTAALMDRMGHAVTVLGSSPDARGMLGRSPLAQRCDFVTGNLLAFPFPDAAFDVVISVRLVSHMPEWERLLGEMCRVARHSVIIDYPRTVGFNRLTPRLFNLKRHLEGNTRTYLSFDDAAIDEAFRGHGFNTAQRVGQFCLPMVLHRVTRASPVLRGLEGILRRVGLTRRMGTPAIARADRTPALAPQTPEKPGVEGAAT